MLSNMTQPAKCLVLVSSHNDDYHYTDYRLLQATSIKPGETSRENFTWHGDKPEVYEEIVAVIVLEDKYRRRNTPQEMLRGLRAYGFTFGVYLQGEEVDLLKKGY